MEASASRAAGGRTRRLLDEWFGSCNTAQDEGESRKQFVMNPSNPTPERALREDPSESPADPVRRLCHEISGPLTSILVQCDLLLQDSSIPDAKERIAAIREEALRITRSLRTASRS